MAEATTRTSLRVARSIGLGVVFTAIVIVLLLWLAGVFHRKIGPVQVALPAGPQRVLGNTPIATARLVYMPAIEPAVGTIRAVYETAIASKLLARVVEVNVQAGQTVRTGDVLVRLDEEDLRARLRQAEAALEAARAERDHARIEFERVDRLFKTGNANRTEWDRAGTDLKTAEARLAQAENARREAETILSYATIRSPLDGRVIDKRVEVGDTVTPGQVLLTLYDPTRMQLVARVRESLAQRLRVGHEIPVQIDAIGKICEGWISEIVPEAEAASRTFSVKVTGPCPDGVYSGMFGRLLIPLDEEPVLLIPQAAVRRVGQLDVVEVVETVGPPEASQKLLRRRAVRLGRTFGDEVEVLAGLREGEQVALWTAPQTVETLPGATATP